MDDTAIIERKRQALNEFTARLFASDVRDAIAKVILFGSVQKGDIRPDSDVDVLVVATRAPDRVTDVCLDAALEVNMALSESVEPLVYCVDRLRFPGSYFVYHALKTGEEVYAMDEKRLRREESQGYLELAEEYVQSARHSLEHGDYRLATDGAYNAAELCAKGFLVLELEDVPSSHGGIVGKFGELYVRTGILPRELGRGLNQGLWLRNQARYERHARIGLEEAREMLDLADRFIVALTEALKIAQDNEV
ncbi:MAG: HEPN domain-containing protein [Anaerolineae bacterium]|nr:HEPN domain-containing protein [Anaerolineae bacterium]